MEEDKRFHIRNDLTYGRGYAYSLQYHIVWCTKYRRGVLKDGIDEELKKYLQKIADEYHFSIIAMEVMPDHNHMIVDCRPQFCPSDMIKILKGNTARWLFMHHPELKNSSGAGICGTRPTASSLSVTAVSTW